MSNVFTILVNTLSPTVNISAADFKLVDGSLTAVIATFDVTFSEAVQPTDSTNATEVSSFAHHSVLFKQHAP